MIQLAGRPIIHHVVPAYQPPAPAYEGRAHTSRSQNLSRRISPAVDCQNGQTLLYFRCKSGKPQRPQTWDRENHER